MKRNKLLTILFFSIFILTIPFCFGLDVGNNNKNVGVNIEIPATVNYSTVNVNNSDYWDGLDNPSDIFMADLADFFTYQRGNTSDEIENVISTQDAYLKNDASDEMSADGWVGLRVKSNDATGCYIDFADNSDDNVGSIKYTHSTNTMDFKVNDDIKMSIASGGQVTIGSTDSNTAFFNVGRATTGIFRTEQTATGTNRGSWLWLYEDDGTGLDNSGKGMRFISRHPSTGTGYPFIIELTDDNDFGVQDSGNVTCGRDMSIDESLFVGEDTFINGDLDNSGNFTGNEIYGMGFNFTSSGVTIPFDVQNLYYNISLGNFTKMNGFTNNSYYMTAQVAGNYLVNYMAIGSGQNNHEYHTAVFVDDVVQEFTTSKKKMSAGGDEVTMAGTGIISLNKNSNVTIRTKDTTGTGDGTFYGATLVLNRVGDIL